MDIYEKFVIDKGFTVCPYDKHHAIGIGDILFNILAVQQGIHSKLYALNLSVFNSELFPNPMNALEMRIALLTDILEHHTTLTPDILQITVCPQWPSVQQRIHYNLYNTLHIDMKPSFWESIIPKVNITGEYLVFHTKLRLSNGCNYNRVQRDVAEFCSTFKTDYKIIILGERTFPSTWEGDIHNIQTLYTELLLLKNNNDVIDLSVEEIYNSLDYNEYKKDLLLIKNAKCNICIGQGGQLCSSLMFGRTTYSTVIAPPPFKRKTLERDGHKCFLYLPDMFIYLLITYGKV
jgi:hypothetical protein